MPVVAILADGSERELATRYGDTVGEVVESLSDNTFLGSANPLADTLVATADGGQVVYADIAQLVDQRLM